MRMQGNEGEAGTAAGIVRNNEGEIFVIPPARRMAGAYLRKDKTCMSKP